MGAGTVGDREVDTINEFTWAIVSISYYLKELRDIWAKKLGISGPQWSIVMALADIVDDNGAPVNAVSKKLHVDSSFITTQSKALEKKGFVRRKPSSVDARVVQLSLTDKTYKRLAELAAERESLNEFIFSAFDDSSFEQLTAELEALQRQLEKARLKATLDL